MSRIRTHKTTKYFNLSNETAQNKNISFEALGLLTYCLSMPEDWEYHPKLIAKQRKIGRDKSYHLFNELIENLHCIRIREKHSGNLSGSVSYDIFCDKEDCLAAIEEYEKDPNIYIEHGNNLKKCFRRPEVRDTENKDTTKKTSKTKETSSSSPPKKKSPKPKESLRSEEEIFSSLEKVEISKRDKLRITKRFKEKESEVARAVEILATLKKRRNLTGSLIHIIENPKEYSDPKPKLTPQQKEANAYIAGLAMNFNGRFKQFYEENIPLIAENKLMIVTNKPYIISLDESESYVEGHITKSLAYMKNIGWNPK